MNDTVTPAEIIAYELRAAWSRRPIEVVATEWNAHLMHQAADWLIMLAERIKAERATAAMTQKSGSVQ